MPAPDAKTLPPADADILVRDMFDRMTRIYLRSVISDALIEEHRRHPAGHHSEPLTRLLAWCQRRPLREQYAVKAEADGTFRIITMAGRRGERPAYVDDERFASVDAARHGVLLRHISDLSGTP
jgi:branched-chain amino acid transport system permease protein